MSKVRREMIEEQENESGGATTRNVKMNLERHRRDTEETKEKLEGNIKGATKETRET